VCGELAVGGGGLVGTWARATRLNRDATPGNAAWGDAARGDLVVAQPALQLDRARIDRDENIRVATAVDDTETV
jgi:hypothetical protein